MAAVKALKSPAAIGLQTMHAAILSGPLEIGAVDCVGKCRQYSIDPHPSSIGQVLLCQQLMHKGIKEWRQWCSRASLYASKGLGH